MRLDEYQREREAMEAATSVKGNLPTGDNERSVQQPNDPLQAIQTALINAPVAQTGGVHPASLQAGGLGSQEQRTEYERQNDQAIRSKEAILDSNTRKNRNTSAGKRTPALGKYEVKAGWLMPAMLERQLNSDLPGLIRAWFAKTYMTRLRASTF
jgi:type IV secretion system protein VirB10